MTDLVQKLVGALEGKLNQMDMAGDAIEAGRYDEALLHVRSLHAEARAALSEAKAGGWQPIETAPKDGRHILISDGERVSVGGWLTDIDHGADWEGQIGMAGWWAVDLGPNSDKPTAWQPLPAPPAQRGEG